MELWGGRKSSCVRSLEGLRALFRQESPLNPGPKSLYTPLYHAPLNEYRQVCLVREFNCTVSLLCTPVHSCANRPETRPENRLGALVDIVLKIVLGVC